jgi:ABC-type uncharacterized transport system permease subunit
MVRASPRWTNYAFQLLAILAALVFTSLVMVLAQADPIEAFRNILVGSIGSVGKFSDVLVAWVPLLLATSGLLVTYPPGLCDCCKTVLCHQR